MLVNELQVLLESVQELLRALAALKHDSQSLKLRPLTARPLAAVVARCVAQWLSHRFWSEVAELLLRRRRQRLHEEAVTACDSLFVTKRKGAVGSRLLR